MFLPSKLRLTDARALKKQLYMKTDNGTSNYKMTLSFSVNNAQCIPPFATLQLQYVKDANKLPYEINAQKHHFRQCI